MPCRTKRRHYCTDNGKCHHHGHHLLYYALPVKSHVPRVAKFIVLIALVLVLLFVVLFDFDNVF
eukprot:scaffold124953_cov19-Prasinocladus_malaysianus.AAC.1